MVRLSLTEDGKAPGKRPLIATDTELLDWSYAYINQVSTLNRQTRVSIFTIVTVASNLSTPRKGIDHIEGFVQYQKLQKTKLFIDSYIKQSKCHQVLELFLPFFSY